VLLLKTKMENQFMRLNYPNKSEVKIDAVSGTILGADHDDEGDDGSDEQSERDEKDSGKEKVEK